MDMRPLCEIKEEVADLLSKAAPHLYLVCKVLEKEDDNTLPEKFLEIKYATMELVRVIQKTYGNYMFMPSDWGK